MVIKGGTLILVLFMVFRIFDDITNITIEHITKVIEGMESDAPIVFKII